MRFFSTTALGASLLGFGVLWPANVVGQDVNNFYNQTGRPSLNFYGAPGLIDMPSAEPLPDGQVAVSVSNFAGQTRTTLTFQAMPRVQASFRYSGIKDADFSVFDTYRDRSFDVRFLLNRESRYLPAVTLGLQDFAGTGIYAGEFVAATKNFSGGRIPGTVKATVGLGWGRFGSSGSIGAPFGADRPTFTAGDAGGDFSTDQWFRGDMAPFAGVEWQINDKWGVKAEYSSDAYKLETSNGNFERKSRFNFATEYQVSERIRLGGYYLFGSEVGVNVQLQLHPTRPVTNLRIPAPRPLYVRPSRRADPQAYGTDWYESQEAGSALVRDALIPLLEAEGLELVEVRTTPSETEVRYRNTRYAATAVSVGRVARVLAGILPDSIETFRIVPVGDSLAQSVVVFRRSDLEALEFSADAPDALLAVTGFEGAAPSLTGSARNEALYPAFNWAVGPYLKQRLFDAEDPVKLDVGVEFSSSFEPAPGWKVAGRVQHRLSGNLDETTTSGTFLLPRVRSNAAEYDRGGATSINNLYASREWKLSPDVYGRVTAGYLERMFGGVSGELLWKPVASRLALGVEANYVKQRAFDDLLGFQDYSIATGHASAYYEFNNGFTGQLDVGQYLAGDVGATFTLEREFANGWRLGGFFTLTSASKEEFGVGSFDKGIKLTIPAEWFIGKPSKETRSLTIRPFQRDGGARLSVPGRLYEKVRSGHRAGLVGNWSGVWE